MALELLEYKVEEYRDRRDVRGGMESVWGLVELLSRESERLSEEQRERFLRLTDELAAAGEARREAQSVPTFDALVLSDVGAVELAAEEQRPPARESVQVAVTPQEREEQAILRRLAHRVWWDDLEEFVERTAALWRAEQGRATARLIFATLQNLSRNAVRSGVSQAGERTPFRVVEPIPNLRDPLVSLSDPDALAEIIRELIGVIMTVGKGGNPLPPEVTSMGAFDYVRRAALAVAADPYAGSFAPPSKEEVTSHQLKLAIQQLVRDRINDEERVKQRRLLEQRLAEVSARERTERQAFRREITAFKLQLEGFFDRLADYLPSKVGGRTAGPRLDGGVIFGVNPLLRWERVPPTATEVTIRLVGPVRLTLAGHDLAITGSGEERALYLDGQELAQDGPTLLTGSRVRAAVFVESDYAHVRIRALEKSLASQIADALVAAFVLRSHQREEILAVLRVLTNNVKGEVQEIIEQATVRAAAVAARAPDRGRTLDGLLRGSARAAGAALRDETVRGLSERMLAAMDENPPDLSGLLDSAHVADHDVQPFTAEPMTFQVGGQRLTVRQYRSPRTGSADSLVAMLPGQVLGSFSSHLVVTRPEGVFIFAKGGQEVAVLLLA